MSLEDLDFEVARGLACVWFGVLVEDLIFDLSAQDGGGWVASARRSCDSPSKAIQSFGYESPSEALRLFAFNVAEDIRVSKYYPT